MYRIFSKDASLHYNLRQLKYLPSGIAGYFRRAFKGWTYSDVWNIDYWFIEIMPQMLQHLRDNGVGFPSDENYPTMESWNEVLDRMIFLLSEMNEDKCSQKNQFWEEYCESGFSGKLNQEYFNREKEIYEYRNKCKNEFFELFSKCFYNLWD